MKISTGIASAASALLLSTTQASPLAPRVTMPGPAISDAEILNYALTLEHLENAFYAQGLKNFTEDDFSKAGMDATVYKNFQSVGSDEAEHVSFLTTALQKVGVTATQACNYSFPVTDVNGFVAVASVLEGVGVSAYLGAAASIMEKAYLTAAGSILTVESRHSAYIRSVLKESPAPQPFDSPLTFNEVYSLAAGFITGCPSTNPPLPVKAFPTLSLDTTGTIKEGTEVMLKTDVEQTDRPFRAAFITVLGPVFSNVTVVDGGFRTTIPQGVSGQSYVVLANCGEIVNDDTTVAGPAIIEITN